jgi:ferritin-like metal-binding protein YciE
MTSLETLHDLFVDELRDIYSAERQLVRALPKMAKAATSPELKQAIEEHLAVTEGQVSRLEQIFEQLAESPRGKTCRAMEGLIEEGEEIAHQKGDCDVIDAGIIGGAQKVEHYEIAAYGTARAHAQALGQGQMAGLLEQSLNEEEEADQTLSQLAEGGINQLATVVEESEQEEQSNGGRARPSRRRTGGSRRSSR